MLGFDHRVWLRLKSGSALIRVQLLAAIAVDLGVSRACAGCTAVVVQRVSSMIDLHLPKRGVASHFEDSIKS